VGLLSGKTIAEADVCRHQVKGQEFGIFTAFSGANFDDAFHWRSPVFLVAGEGIEPSTCWL
jgi:hypothetical protein